MGAVVSRRNRLLVALLVSSVVERATGQRNDESSSFYVDPLQYTTDTMYSTWEWFAGANACPYRSEVFSAVQSNLQKHIKGQDEGLNAILNALSGWEFQRQAGNSAPLVLALTGPTGVGKSESAYRIAEGMLARKVRVGKSAKLVPSGLLELRGEDYSKGDVGQNQEAIQGRIADHLESCGGNAVIVFDEVQKVLPGILEVLMPALERRGSISRTRHVPEDTAFLFPARGHASASTMARAVLQYTAVATTEAVQYVGKALVPTPATSSQEQSPTDVPKQRNKAVTTQHSTENVVFIFISDIGADRMTKLVLSYGNRSHIPETLLRSEIKTALDEQWEQLRFGKFIDEVVPYLPLEPEHIRDIMRSKLRHIAEKSRHSNWAELLVDDDVVVQISGPPLVKYSVYSTKGASSKGTGNGSMGPGGDTTCTASGEGGAAGECAGTAAEGMALAALPSAPPTGVTKVFATWGARSLENAGPLQDLRSLLHRYARPWRPDQILHVGLHSEANRELRNAKWGTQEKAGTITAKSPKQVFLQWCKASPQLRTCVTHSEVPGKASTGASPPAGPVCEEGMAQYFVDDTVAFSPDCETVRFGLNLA